MIKSIPDSVQEFMKKYEPTILQKEKISKHHTYIREVIKKKFIVVDDFLTGSYVKQTQIKPPTDVDLFIVISDYFLSPKRINSPRKLISWFRHILGETYSSSTLKLDGQAIVIKFSEGICMDVVPAFKGIKSGYIIPNVKSNTWIRTDPKAYNNLLSSVNKALDGKLIPMIKMAKCWNFVWGKALKSLHIEILTLNCFYDQNKNEVFPFENYQEGLSIFFNKAENLVKEFTFEPVIGDIIDQYLPIGKRSMVSSLFKAHYAKIKRALDYEYSGNHARARQIWKYLFKHYFPAL